MSRAPGGRSHLWFWVTPGVLLYVASCPLVEAWHERHYAQNSRNLPLSAASLSSDGTDASAATSAGEGGFEIVELKYHEPPKRPVWMQFLYAPVHVAEQYPPFAPVFQRYRLWCEGVF